MKKTKAKKPTTTTPKPENNGKATSLFRVTAANDPENGRGVCIEGCGDVVWLSTESAIALATALCEVLAEMGEI